MVLTSFDFLYICSVDVSVCVTKTSLVGISTIYVPSSSFFFLFSKFLLLISATFSVNNNNYIPPTQPAPVCYIVKSMVIALKVHETVSDCYENVSKAEIPMYVVTDKNVFEDCDETVHSQFQPFIQILLTSRNLKHFINRAEILHRMTRGS